MSNRRMNPALKKVLAAVAVKKVVDRIQEARAPKRSFVRRNLGKLLFGAVGVTGLYLYKNGALDKVMGGGSSGSQGYRDSYPTGPGTEPIQASSGASTPADDRPLETTQV